VPVVVNSAPHAAPRQRAVRAVEAVGQHPVALDEERVEAEDLHFLRRLDAGAGLPDVVQLAPSRRAAVIQGVAARVEVQLAQERRHQRDEQQRDQPRRVRDQARREGGDRDDVLCLPEQLRQQRQPAAGLPPRPLQAVLHLAVLEVLQVQRRRVLHQPHAGRVVEALREEGVRQRDHAAQHVGDDGQRQFDDEQPRERVQQPRIPPRAETLRPRHARQPDHLVDDQLADVKRHYRQQCPKQPHPEVGQRQPRRRLPDQAQKGRQIPESAHPFPK
jgi:hypothetical protein